MLALFELITILMPELANWLGGKSKNYKLRFLRAGLGFIVIAVAIKLFTNIYYDDLYKAHNQFALDFAPFMIGVCGVVLVFFYFYALFLGDKYK